MGKKKDKRRPRGQGFIKDKMTIFEKFNLAYVGLYKVNWKIYIL